MFLREQGQDSEECQQAAELLGAQIVRKYVQEHGFGNVAGHSLRKMLDELLTLRDAQYVIVTSPDRLTRRVDLMATIARELKQVGASLVFARHVLNQART